jgi:hypothetical protein
MVGTHLASPLGRKLPQDGSRLRLHRHLVGEKVSGAHPVVVTQFLKAGKLLDVANLEMLT